MYLNQLKCSRAYCCSNSETNVRSFYCIENPGIHAQKQTRIETKNHVKKRDVSLSSSEWGMPKGCFISAKSNDKIHLSTHLHFSLAPLEDRYELVLATTESLVKPVHHETLLVHRHHLGHTQTAFVRHSPHVSLVIFDQIYVCQNHCLFVDIV